MLRAACRRPLAFSVIAAVSSLGVVACGGSSEPEWQLVHDELPGALLSVWGTGETDVWTVGADAGDGPTVMHYDGAGWKRLDTGEAGHLWWIHGFEGGPIFMGGQGGLIVRYEDGAFTRMPTPGTGTVFGIWGADPDDVWAVGGNDGGQGGAFAWRLTGDAWRLADGFPAELADTDAIWKVHGRSTNDVWMVGTSGAALHWDGAKLVRDDIPTGASMFTLHADEGGFAAVGGYGQGQIFERRGEDWVDTTPSRIEPLVGVHLGRDFGVAVGDHGVVLRREQDDWIPEDTGLRISESLHAVWVDPSGGVWAVGGETQVFPLVRGIMIYRGHRALGETR